MAKTISIDTNQSYTSPRSGLTMTVGQALAWEIEHASENEEGETTAMSPGALIVYAVMRKRALAKDSKRHAKGEAPERIYTPRVDIKDAPETAAKVKAAAAARFAEMLGVELSKSEPVKAKPAKAPPATAKPVKVADERKASKLAENAKRIAEIEAKLAAKPAAKLPAVRKAHARSGERVPDYTVSTALRPVDAHVQGISMSAPSADDLLTLAAAAEKAGDLATATKLMAQALN